MSIALSELSVSVNVHLQGSFFSCVQVMALLQPERASTVRQHRTRERTDIVEATERKVCSKTWGTTSLVNQTVFPGHAIDFAIDYANALLSDLRAVD